MGQDDIIKLSNILDGKPSRPQTFVQSTVESANDN